MDVTRLRDADLQWADYVLIGAMIVHKQSIDEEIIPRCKRLGRTIIGGGPLFTTGYEEYAGDVHAVCGECEEIIDDVVRDMELGELKPKYESTHGFPDVTQDARAALGPDQRAALRDDADPVFARLPVRLRVLRHHHHERPQAAHQNARADDRRARRAVRGRLDRHGVLRGRQLHRQQEAGEAVLAGADRVARARASRSWISSPRRR